MHTWLEFFFQKFNASVRRKLLGTLQVHLLELVIRLPHTTTVLYSPRKKISSSSTFSSSISSFTLSGLVENVHEFTLFIFLLPFYGRIQLGILCSISLPDKQVNSFFSFAYPSTLIIWLCIAWRNEISKFQVVLLGQHMSWNSQNLSKLYQGYATYMLFREVRDATCVFFYSKLRTKIETEFAHLTYNLLFTFLQNFFLIFLIS